MTQKKIKYDAGVCTKCGKTFLKYEKPDYYNPTKMRMNYECTDCGTHGFEEYRVRLEFMGHTFYDGFGKNGKFENAGTRSE